MISAINQISNNNMTKTKALQDMYEIIWCYRDDQCCNNYDKQTANYVYFVSVFWLNQARPVKAHKSGNTTCRNFWEIDGSSCYKIGCGKKIFDFRG